MSGGTEAAATVLALNCGSSSLKFGVYKTEPGAARVLCEGEAEEIGGAEGSLWIQAQGSARKVQKTAFREHSAAFGVAFDALRQHGLSRFEAVGHRFVQGGPLVREHTLLDATVLRDLEASIEYAPLHMPASLAVLRAAIEKLPDAPQAICLDTAFHRHMPEVSRTYALPEEIRARGVERYGFHGISLESIVAQLDPLPKRIVAAHLGNGSSITAIRDGVSIDTSMGMTPTGGVMMGTRCGDLDPGILVYLLRHGYSNAVDTERACDRQSGLLGISGATSDVRELSSRRKVDPKAELALAMFSYQVKKTIAAMAAALGGLDALVFTGGIGEHAAEIRDEIANGIRFLGNFDVRILPSLEDEQIAKNTARLFQNSRI